MSGGRRRAVSKAVCIALAAGLGLTGPACREPAPSQTPDFLLLVTVDTLRADALGAYGSSRGLTPNLDALAAESILFETAYAPTPFTLPSLVALHTGRHPLELGLRTNLSIVPDDTTTLAEELGSRGWATAAVVSNFVLTDRTDVGKGFAIYDDTMLQREAVRRWPERIAGETTSAAIALLDVWRSDPVVSKQPIFLWVHYQDPHGPYTPPPGWRQRFEAAARRIEGPATLPRDDEQFGDGGIPGYQIVDEQLDVAFYRAGYDAEVAYMDQEVGRLFRALRQRGLYDDARIVFAADHGESLGDHGFWFSHGHHVTDDLVRVPLLLRFPGRPAARRAEVASLLDVRATVRREILGALPDPDEPGRDLLAPDAADHPSRPLLATLFAYPKQRFGLVADGYKLILTHDDDIWSSQLFRLGHEQIDLSAPAPQITAKLREELRVAREHFDTGIEPRSREMSDEARRALEALGYLPVSDE